MFDNAFQKMRSLAGPEAPDLIPEKQQFLKGGWGYEHT